VKPHINLVDVHPQLSNDGHPVDGALVHCGPDEVLARAVECNL